MNKVDSEEKERDIYIYLVAVQGVVVDSTAQLLGVGPALEAEMVVGLVPEAENAGEPAVVLDAVEALLVEFVLAQEKPQQI